MAGNWIKMRTDLHSHPKVVRIVSALHADICPQSVQLASEKFRVIGGLHAVWSLFDAHSEDGSLVGYTPETLDATIGFPGLARAMAAVNWLTITTQALVLPEFDTHNGQSAKRRAQDADRKAAVRNLSASDADKKRTREDKNREEVKAKSGAPAAPVDPKKVFWDTAVECVGEKNRARIGKLSKQYGEEVVAKALTETMLARPADPMAYVAQIVQKAGGNPWDGAL